jgi:hypothetical protein
MQRKLSPSTWIIVGLSLAVCGMAAAVFVTPSKDDRTAAAGNVNRLDPPLRRAFSDGGEFEAKREPGGGDWLASHDEPGQTFERWANSNPNIPGAGRMKLYILPIGEFEKGIAPDLEKLKEYYECNMNGANHLDEADSTPMHLCPVCLRKLHRAVRFDPTERYGKLREFYDANGMKVEEEWVTKRIVAIRGAK